LTYASEIGSIREVLKQLPALATAISKLAAVAYAGRVGLGHAMACIYGQNKRFHYNTNSSKSSSMDHDRLLLIFHVVAQAS
jgi:hypothetical protein